MANVAPPPSLQLAPLSPSLAILFGNQEMPSPSPKLQEKEDNKKFLVDTLTLSCINLFEATTQQERTLINKLRLRDVIYYHLSPVFPLAGLYVIGSSLNGFGTENSDVDLCLVVTPCEVNQQTEAVSYLEFVQNVLSRVPHVREQVLINAKVPILRMKFDGPFRDLIVDLNINNIVAVRNTHLLGYYAFFDWRIRPLIMTVKRWAKQSGINDSTRSTFTSYSLVLMALHYLQISKIVPSLQNLYPKRFYEHADVRTLNFTARLEDVHRNVMERNETSLGELLMGFFHYYANFDYDKNAISVRLGRSAERNEMDQGRQWALIFVEEPFTRSNTAHSVFDVKVFESIRAKFRQAHEVLLQTLDVNELLKTCSPSDSPAINTLNAPSPALNSPNAPSPALNSPNASSPAPNSSNTPSTD